MGARLSLARPDPSLGWHDQARLYRDLCSTLFNIYGVKLPRYLYICIYVCIYIYEYVPHICINQLHLTQEISAALASSRSMVARIMITTLAAATYINDLPLVPHTPTQRPLHHSPQPPPQKHLSHPVSFIRPVHCSSLDPRPSQWPFHLNPCRSRPNLAVLPSSSINPFFLLGQLPPRPSISFHINPNPSNLIASSTVPSIRPDLCPVS